MNLFIHYFFSFFLLTSVLHGSINMPTNVQAPDFSIENRILAKIDTVPISVLDVKKRMDILFHKNYPKLMNNEYARFQFYQTSWKKVLEEMVHTELMLLDAEQKEIKISTGEVHETLINRFGPNVIDTLEDIGITYTEAEELIEKEMIVQRMLWFYVHQKALQTVHPIDIRKAYQKFLQTNPKKEYITYKVISVKGPDSLLVAESLYAKIRFALSLDLQDLISSYNTKEHDVSIKLSSPLKRESADIAKQHLAILRNLSEGEFSKPFSQKNQYSQKILYLKSKETTHPPALQEKYEELQRALIQRQAKKYSLEYMTKLKNTHLPSEIMEDIPASFQPFVIR